MTKRNTQPITHRIAYFISPHGFGHAARAAAVMAATHKLEPTVRFEIFTQVPAWFFETSLSQPFGYHALLTDIGVAQKDSLTEDLPGTVKRLGDFLPFDPVQIENLAQQVTGLKCRLIICDIAPMGIAVAQAARIPALLVENFTWDWIYAGYLAYESRLEPYITQLRRLFEAADYHIQTEPVCDRRPADLTTLPISRGVKTPAKQIRRKLGLPDQTKMVLLTMGGVPWQYTFLEQLKNHRHLYFVIPGASHRLEVRNNLLLLPDHSDFFHPDLINASDVVIGKVGYSTVAEVYRGGIPFGYIARQRFRESEALVAYINQHMNGLAISEAQFEDGSWLSLLPDLLAMPRLNYRGPNGADQAARFILDN